MTPGNSPVVSPTPHSEEPQPGTADWLMPTEHLGTAAGDLMDVGTGKIYIKKKNTQEKRGTRLARIGFKDTHSKTESIARNVRLAKGELYFS